MNILHRIIVRNAVPSRERNGNGKYLFIYKNFVTEKSRKLLFLHLLRSFFVSISHQYLLRIPTSYIHSYVLKLLSTYYILVEIRKIMCTLSYNAHTEKLRKISVQLIDIRISTINILWLLHTWPMKSAWRKEATRSLNKQYVSIYIMQACMMRCLMFLGIFWANTIPVCRVCIKCIIHSYGMNLKSK